MSKTATAEKATEKNGEKSPQTPQRPKAAVDFENAQKALEIKLQQAEGLAALQRGYNNLTAELLAIKSWEIKMDEGGLTNYASITLSDSNRKSFSTSNPVLVSLMTEHLKELFTKKKAEIEKQLLAYTVS